MMIGDGGQSGFDVAMPDMRFHTFTGPSADVNFDNGDIADWIWTGDPMAFDRRLRVLLARHQRPQGQRNDIRRDRLTAYRTKTFGLGSRTIAEAQRDLQRVDRQLHRAIAVTGRDSVPPR